VSAFLEMLAMATETMAQFVLSDSQNDSLRQEHAQSSSQQAQVA
jgi:hypothetical protein